MKTPIELALTTLSLVTALTATAAGPDIEGCGMTVSFSTCPFEGITGSCEVVRLIGPE